MSDWKVHQVRETFMENVGVNLREHGHLSVELRSPAFIVVLCVSMHFYTGKAQTIFIILLASLSCPGITLAVFQISGKDKPSEKAFSKICIMRGIVGIMILDKGEFKIDQ